MWLLAAGAVTTAWLPRTSADPARGERVFQRCFACHSVVAGEDGLPGPNLRGVIGRYLGDDEYREHKRQQFARWTRGHDTYWHRVQTIIDTIGLS